MSALSCPPQAASPTLAAATPARPPPHRCVGHTYRDIHRGWTLAAALAGLCGTAYFGWAALQVIVIAGTAALLTEIVIDAVLRRPVRGEKSHAFLMGLLLALTLPATAPWYVPLVGGAAAIALAKAPFGGMGRYVWQPAAAARVLLQVLFFQSLATGGETGASPVLAHDRLFYGNINYTENAGPRASLGWQALDAPEDGDAWALPSPVRQLHLFAQGRIPRDEQLIFEPLLRDRLPPWRDTVWGTVPGGIGETCTIGLIVVGLFLIYRGYLRWQLPVVLLASAALAAGILPVKLFGDAGWYWFPLRAVENGRPVGLAYILYHLTSGDLMLAAFLIAGDLTSSPKRVHGQMVFAAGIGLTAIFMRLYGMLECECYWAILLMNCFTGMIDRWLKRPVLGIPEPQDSPLAGPG